ncbi:1-acyl-sn-glycerol-3-phosphate acyltransferase [Candidatus Bipolaricaulota bacterium]|nr:1-acyl-sn-glycerol-3-phosphate acyltransferase [Candidatus Bipolaricaulota bacterium]
MMLGDPDRRGIPHHGVRRMFLRFGIRVLCRLLIRLRVEGAERVPKSGPLLIVANHFHFADPVVIIRSVPGQLEFLGGARLPNAPRAIRWIPRIWGYYAVRRGTGARTALQHAEELLRRGGRIAVFPEGGSWAGVLRPARPGTAFLAVRTGATVLPVGIDGMMNILPMLRRLRRATVTIRFGDVIGPFEASGKGRERRAELDEIGAVIMPAIARLLPEERRGVFSGNETIRAAAQEAAAYPWAPKRRERPSR